MKNINSNLIFPHFYEIECEIELPCGLTGVEQFYYPRAVENSGGNDFVVKIIPREAPSWIGIFAQGYPKALTGVFSCPNETYLCVVSSGRACIVQADNPQIWEQVPLLPVYDIRPIIERQLLIFSGLTRLVAYDRNGLRWITPDLSWDGLRIVNVTRDSVSGVAWDSPNGREVEFLVDIRTGQHKGGTSPTL